MVYRKCRISGVDPVVLLPPEINVFCCVNDIQE